MDTDGRDDRCWLAVDAHAGLLGDQDASGIGRDAAQLAFESPAEPAHMARLMPDVENVLQYGSSVLAAIQRVHQVGPLREDTYVRTTGAAGGIRSKFPIAAVWDWKHAVDVDLEPQIVGSIRFASDPIAPRMNVQFIIGYRTSVDGTENLVYRITEIREQEAQDPQGS